jgi:hypothetical protein
VANTTRTSLLPQDESDNDALSAQEKRTFDRRRRTRHHERACCRAINARASRRAIRALDSTHTHHGRASLRPRSSAPAHAEHHRDEREHPLSIDGIRASSNGQRSLSMGHFAELRDHALIDGWG